jgi:hypothetical protein
LTNCWLWQAIFNENLLHNAFFADTLFDKSLNFSQAFWSILNVQLHVEIRFICRTFVWQEFKLFKSILKHIAFTMTCKNTTVLPTNCLTRIQTIHKHFEAYCQYDNMKKYTFFRRIVWQEFKLFTGILKHISCTITWKNTPFSEQLFDKNSNYSQAFWSILPVL